MKLSGQNRNAVRNFPCDCPTKIGIGVRDASEYALHAGFAQLWTKLDAALSKAALVEEAEKRASDSNETSTALQKEASRLEKVEARFEIQTNNLQEQNVALTKKAEALSSDLNEARLKTAKIEAKLEAGAQK